jgi:cytochrome c556
MEVCVRNRCVGGLVYSITALIMAAHSFDTAAAEPEDIIKYRKAVMKSQGGHMSAAAEIVKGKVDFARDLPYHAEALAASLHNVAELFPTGSDFGETRAKPEVWNKRVEFEKAVTAGAQAGAAFLAAVKSNDRAAIQEKFGALAETCKGCHKDFREKEN